MPRFSFSLREIAAYLDVELRGDASAIINGLATLESAGPGDLAFLSNPKYETQLATCQAEAVILHSNQVIKLWIVPVNDAQEPMLGLLNLTANGPDNIVLDAPLSGHGAAANSLLIKPNGNLGDTVQIDVLELSEDMSLELKIKTTEVPAACN